MLDIIYIYTYMLDIGDSSERSPYSGISSPEEEVGTNNAQHLTQETRAQETRAQGALLSPSGDCTYVLEGKQCSEM
jgi:hypothetical protein